MSLYHDITTQQGERMSAITPQELAERKAAGERIELIDVRTPMEFHRVHVDFARNVPLDELRPEQISPAEPVYVICQSGSRGRTALNRLVSEGVDAVNVEGGTSAWEA